ncbi:RNA polymerase sigma-70 factor [candidate division KSB1 bacterium]|nr:RNA polymerase sigma-70 factor [candidate division KSB1 bacterium]
MQYINAEHIKKIKKGDVRSFELLFNSYAESLLKFAVRYVHDLNIAEDIIQNVFMTVWKYRSELQEQKNIKSYLFTITKNQCLKYIRHNKVEQEYAARELSTESESTTPLDIVQEKETRHSINNAIQELPEKCRIIFCMNRFDRLTYAEIAEIQGISIKTVETQMMRALKYLRKKLSHLNKK